MLELEDEIYEKILRLSKKGEQHLQEGLPDLAIPILIDAIDLLPNPKSQWEASEWLHATLGDAYAELGKYEDALSCFQEARNAGDEADPNPYVLLRIGTCLFRLGDKQLAAQFLTQAYMLEGNEIFCEEPDEVVSFVRSLALD